MHKMNVTFETCLLFVTFCYWNWPKLPSQSTAFVHPGLYSDLWPVGTTCSCDIHTDRLFFLLTGGMEFLEQLLRLKQLLSSTRGCCWTSKKKSYFGEEGGGGGWGGRDWGGRGIEKKSWKKTWHFCLRWRSMLCWCHMWNVSEVSVINTSIRNLLILYLCILYPKESHTKTSLSGSNFGSENYGGCQASFPMCDIYLLSQTNWVQGF